MKALEHTVAQLRALAAFAYPEPDRLAITQIKWEPTCVVATNGHRLIRVELPEDKQRNFGLVGRDVLRWTKGLNGSMRIGIERAHAYAKGMMALRPLDSNEQHHATLLLRESTEAFPPHDAVMPLCLRAGGWPEYERRNVKPHALSVAYLEGLGDLWKAFGLTTSGQGIELLDAPSKLDPIVYGVRAFLGDSEKEERRSLLVMIMPMRAD